MMKQKVLFVTQEITPYLPESEMSLIGRYLPQGIQKKEKRAEHSCHVLVQSMNVEINCMKSSACQV